MDNIPSNSDKLKRLEDVLCFNNYIITYGYTNSGEGIFQKYYIADGRWITLRCRNLPFRVSNFSMTKYGNDYLLVNGKNTDGYKSSSSYTIRLGHLTEQELSFNWSYILDNDENCINQQILTDGTNIFTVVSYEPNKTKIFVHNIDITDPRKFKLYATSSRPLPRVNVNCRAVHYNRHIFMFTHISPNEQGESLVRFDTVDVYDVPTDRWIRDLKTTTDRRPGHCPTARVRFGWAQCPTDERYVYVTGGHGHGTADERPGPWRLDLRTFRWTDMSAVGHRGDWPRPPPVEHHAAVAPAAGTVVYVLDDRLAAAALRPLRPAEFVWLPPPGGDDHRSRGRSAIPAPGRRPLPCPVCFRVKCPNGRRTRLLGAGADEVHSHTCPFCTAADG